MDFFLRSKACLYLHKFYASLSKAFIGGFNAFYLNLDTITDCASMEDMPTEQHSTFNSKSSIILDQFKQSIYYLIAAVGCTLIHLDSFVILARVNFQYTYDGTRDLLSRKVTPKELWFQSDGVLNIGWLISCTVYWLLLLMPGLPPKFRIYAIAAGDDHVRIFSNGKFWNTDCVDKIMRFRMRARKIYRYSFPCGVIMAGGYWAWNSCQNYTGTWHDAIIVASTPLQGIFGNFGIASIVFFISLSIEYFQIRQAALLSQLESFTNELLAKPSKQSNVYIWQRFCALNQEILLLNIELRAYSLYWCPFLTVVFVGYIGLINMLLYGWVYQTDDLNVFYRSFFVFFTIEFSGLLLLITHECAVIVQNNIKIFKTNRAFCYAYTRLGQPDAICLLKMSKIIANYKGIKNGFRLINNFLIDSKMYEIVIFYMCSVYMVLINQESKYNTK